MGEQSLLESDLVQLDVADRPVDIEASKHNTSTAITLWDRGGQGLLGSDLSQLNVADRPLAIEASKHKLLLQLPPGIGWPGFVGIRLGPA